MDSARPVGAVAVKPPVEMRRWAFARIIACCVLLLVAAPVHAQTASSERVFPQSKAAVEKALKAIEPSLSGHLPLLEGFAQPGEHPLDRYRRAYYQATLQVDSTARGGSLVRVSAKVTAWYNDPVGSRSGYQALKSNGRIEEDLLDQLAEQLAASSKASGGAEPVRPAKLSAEASKPEPAISAPSASSGSANGLSSPLSLSESLATEESASARSPSRSAVDKAQNRLEAEAASLEEILKNQAHPRNLVAIKKSGTPVVSSPSLTAKPLFLASLHDEFEMLDFSRDWVHVRISGLSRGWLWRTSVEMPEGISDTNVPPEPAVAPAADLFHVVREETSTFPGDWEPLRDKSVKILSVQKVNESEKDAGPKARLEYAKFLLDENYQEIAQRSQSLAGIVLIFDSVDGGMIAATVSALQQWRAGKLSDSALWHNCFFDPPETFDSTEPAPGH